MKEYYIIMALSNCEEISHERLNQFVKYHEKNPQLWTEFKAMAHEKIKIRKGYSSKAIFEIVRHEREKKVGDDGFVANNNFTSIYPRLLEAIDPQFIGFFRYRKIKKQINAAVYDRDGERALTV